ncbi:hypothetical protein C9374_011766 [Naegleria lovaniensis]|uniref:Anoctamin transmembrane domain-containing protein n=1 Tax=Naegleria lovaniensis TaxID=51637 RepID=A0AA88KF91_NAELO|nr:uncharacterized protein C9374_011766 [Naegleria lovaniensis]KAG2373881.1 hypothetical protein C9374_011766 [Naegleria lovaniensis]
MPQQPPQQYDIGNSGTTNYPPTQYNIGLGTVGAQYLPNQPQHEPTSTTTYEKPPSYELDEEDMAANEHSLPPSQNTIVNTQQVTLQDQQQPPRQLHPATQMAMGEDNEQDPLEKHRDLFGLGFVKDTTKHLKETTIWESGFFGLNIFTTTAQKKKKLKEISEMNRVESTDILGKDQLQHHMKHHKKYTVMRTARGQPYLLKTGLDIDEVKEVQNEFSQIRLPFCCSWKTLEDHYGLGVRLYFDFGRLVIVLNAILLFFQLINFIPHLIIDTIYIQTFTNFFKGEFSNYGGLIDILYGSSYDPNLYILWVVTSSFSILATVLFGPIYWFVVRRSFQKRDVYDMEEADMALAFDADADIIKENVETPTLHRVGRYLVSYSIFVGFLILSCAITIGFTILQNFTTIYEAADAVFSQNTGYLTLISIGISCVVNIVNFIWKKICIYLTNFEKHKTWSGYRTHNTMKYLFFKLFNVFLMGFTKGLFNVPCVIRTLGNQYLIQMILDFVVFNAIELILPYIEYYIKKKRNKGSDENVRPDFDVSEEYLELIYRQYIIYCGMTSFPMITLIAFVASILELYLDKWRLLKLCKKPPMINGSVKTVVSFFLIITAILPMINWGGGNIYPMVGVYWCNTPSNLECEPCRILNGNENYITNFVNKLYGYS